MYWASKLNGLWLGIIWVIKGMDELKGRDAARCGGPQGSRSCHSKSDLELRHPRCLFKIRCGQGSQNTTNYIVYINAELHVSAYVEAIFRFVIAS